MNNDLMAINGLLSRRDAFPPFSSGNKGQFCFISQKKKNLIRISPPYRFCMSQRSIATSKLLPTTTDNCYQVPTVVSNLQNLPLY